MNARDWKLKRPFIQEHTPAGFFGCFLNRAPLLMAFVMTIIFAGGCSHSEELWKPDTQWHAEAVAETNCAWRGSYRNARETLRVRSQEWKLIAYDPKKDVCEWGFKVILEFPKHPDYKPQSGFTPVMPIEKIDYELYDKDGFHITSLKLSGKDLCVPVEKEETFQYTGFISSALARRAAFGKVNIAAGYPPDPPKPK
jgi:hypothetical protein